MSTFIAPSSSILVTGAKGYIASHVIARLLQQGYKVVGTVRSLASKDLVVHTHGSHPNLAVILVDDITNAQNYLTALSSNDIQPLTAIIHLAAPFSYAVKDFETDLLKPAVAGTQAILEVAQVLEVRRVVHTNSFACIYDASLGSRPGYTYTEKDWSPLTYEQGKNAADVAKAYRAAKTAAEKAGRDFVEERGGVLSFDLVSLCPAMVFGPFLNAAATPKSPEGLGESVKIVWNIVSAGHDAAVPPTRGPVWVDVRDVVDAHVKALQQEEAGGKRYLLAAGMYCNQEIADEVRGLGLGPPTVPIGVPEQRESGMFGVDGRKAERELGISYISLKDSLADLIPQLLDIVKGR